MDWKDPAAVKQALIEVMKAGDWQEDTAEGFYMSVLDAGLTPEYLEKLIEEAEAEVAAS